MEGFVITIPVSVFWLITGFVVGFFAFWSWAIHLSRKDGDQ